MYKFLKFPYFFYYDFIIYIDFTHIAASNIATDDSHIEYLIRTYNILVLIL